MLPLFPPLSMKKISTFSFLQCSFQKYTAFLFCNSAVVPGAIPFKFLLIWHKSILFAPLQTSSPTETVTEAWKPHLKFHILQRPYLGNEMSTQLSLSPDTCNSVFFTTHCYTSLIVLFSPSNNCLAPGLFSVITLSMFYMSVKKYHVFHHMKKLQIQLLINAIG